MASVSSSARRVAASAEASTSARASSRLARSPSSSAPSCSPALRRISRSAAVFGLRRGLAQRRDLLAQGGRLGSVALEIAQLLLQRRDLLTQLALLGRILCGGSGLARGQLALQRGQTGLELAGARRGPLALGLRSRQLGAQRRDLLLCAGRILGAGGDGVQALDLLLELALAQLDDLAIDDVLEPGARLEQLDLHHRGLALEFAQLRGVGTRPDGRAGVSARGDALELALLLGQPLLQALDLDRLVVHERRIFEHRLRHLAAVALVVDVALEVGDHPFLALDDIAQLHRHGSLLGQPFTAVGILERSNSSLALLENLAPLVELQLQFVQEALTLLGDALFDRVFLDSSERSAQAAACTGLCGLV